MARGLSTSLTTAITSPSCHIVTFASLAFSTGTVYVHNDIGTITWSGQDWLGVGSLGSVGRIQEGSALSPYGVQLVLTGVDPDDISGAPSWPDFVQEFLNNDYAMREVVLYVGARDILTHAMLADPDEIWRGYMENATFTVAKSSGDAIVIECESELALLDRASNLIYSDAKLQQEYSGDLFFEFLPQMENAQPPWRVPGATGGQLVSGSQANPATSDPYWWHDPNALGELWR